MVPQLVDEFLWSEITSSDKISEISAAKIPKWKLIKTSFLTGTGRILSPAALGLVDGRVLQEKPDRPVDVLQC